MIHKLLSLVQFLWLSRGVISHNDLALNLPPPHSLSLKWIMAGFPRSWYQLGNTLAWLGWSFKWWLASQQHQQKQKKSTEDSGTSTLMHKIFHTRYFHKNQNARRFFGTVGFKGIWQNYSDAPNPQQKCSADFELLSACSLCCSQELLCSLCNLCWAKLLSNWSKLLNSWGHSYTDAY